MVQPENPTIGTLDVTRPSKEPGATPVPAGLWQAWCDGSALPNPGRIGVGVVLLSPGGARSERYAVPGCHGCNNEAELYALCAALEFAYGMGAKRLLLRGDSDVAIRYVAGTDVTAIVRLAELVAHARQWLTRFEEVQLLWIPRHRNGAADRLSRQALGLPDKPAASAKRKRRKR